MDWRHQQNFITALLLWCIFKIGNSQECHSEMDVMIVADGSASVCEESLEVLRTPVSNLIDELHLRNNDTRFGLVLYSTGVFKTIDFTHDTRFLKNEIRKLKYSCRSTNTAQGITRMSRIFVYLGRPRVHRVGIVITDGKSNNIFATKTAASNAKKLYKVNMFVVEVGEENNNQELLYIASTQNHILDVSNFTRLSRTLLEIDHKACPESTDVPTEAQVSSDAPKDVISKDSDYADYTHSITSTFSSSGFLGEVSKETTEGSAPEFSSPKHQKFQQPSNSAVFTVSFLTILTNLVLHKML